PGRSFPEFRRLSESNSRTDTDSGSVPVPQGVPVDSRKEFSLHPVQTDPGTPTCSQNFLPEESHDPASIVSYHPKHRPAHSRYHGVCHHRNPVFLRQESCSNAPDLSILSDPGYVLSCLPDNLSFQEEPFFLTYAVHLLNLPSAGWKFFLHQYSHSHPAV